MGQERIAASTVVVAGDDLACEVVARALGAAGVGRLSLIRRGGPLRPEVVGAVMGANPLLCIETRAWPASLGQAWLSAISGATVVVRSGFDDDPMLRAAVRLGVPVVVMRGREDSVDVVSFRHNGPCPHAVLDVPEKAATPSEDGAAAVVAAHLAAAETLALIAGAISGAGRARHLTIPLRAVDGQGTNAVSDARSPAAAAAVGATARATDIPWAPECFACGGAAREMSFS